MGEEVRINGRLGALMPWLTVLGLLIGGAFAWQRFNDRISQLESYQQLQDSTVRSINEHGTSALDRQIALLQSQINVIANRQTDSFMRMDALDIKISRTSDALTEHIRSVRQ